MLQESTPTEIRRDYCIEKQFSESSAPVKLKCPLDELKLTIEGCKSLIQAAKIPFKKKVVWWENTEDNSVSMECHFNSDNKQHPCGEAIVRFKNL